MYEKKFKADGFEVSIAYDGLEGLEKATKEMPDLVILDIMLPKLDGLAVFKKNARQCQDLQNPGLATDQLRSGRSDLRMLQARRGGLFIEVIGYAAGSGGKGRSFTKRRRRNPPSTNRKARIHTNNYKSEGKVRKQGFNLIEILLIIGIVLILAAVVVVIINPKNLLAKSRDAQRFSDISSLVTATNLYLADNKTF